ncbi:MAG: carboxypeptidase-like regulatory domain-containing protein, partial [Terriglobales bacterium]
RVSISNGNGFFSFNAIPVGTYSVITSNPGFITYTKKDIDLHASDRVQVSGIVLKTGGVSQTVEVSAEAEALVPTDTGEKSQTITSKQVENLAIVGRNAVELLKILPGVVNTGYTGEVTAFNQGVGSYNINGTRNDTLAIVNDGADTIDPGCNCGSSVTANVDMIAEVTVKTANFSSENNKGPVVIESVDKSGGNKFHGEGYYYLRDHSMNANDWQSNAAGTPRPKSRFQYPGFNIGGPVLIPGTGFNKNRDKLFFFAGVEYQRQGVDLGLKRAVVPTAAMRAGDFTNSSYIKSLNGGDVNGLPCQATPLPSYCSGQGTIATSSFDPGGIVLNNLYPLPNADPATHNGYNYLSQLVNPQNRKQMLFRVDYNISQNTKLYSRFNHETESEPYPYGEWWNPSDVPYPSNTLGSNHSNSLSTSLTSVFNPTLTNEVVVAATRLVLPNSFTDPNKVSRKALGYPYRGIYTPGEDIVPNVTDWGSGVANIISPGGFIPVLFANKWVNSITDNLSKVSGTHLLKFGLYLQHDTNDQPTSNRDQGDVVPTTWGGNSTGNAYADLLIGHIGQFGQSSSNITGLIAGNEFDGYAQDSWKVMPRLTLDYGARFFHMGWFYDKLGRIGIFDPSRYSASAPISAYSGLYTHITDPKVPRSGFKTPSIRVAPHFGFAYDLSGKGDTVIRGGFGTYFYRDQGNVFFGAISNPPYALSSGQCCGFTLASLDSITPGAAKTSLNVLDPHDNRIPLTYSYSLTLSKRLPYGTVMEASYVGNSSHNQIYPSGYNINQVPEGSELGMVNPGTAQDDALRPYTSYQGINENFHGLTQHYDSFQLTASRQTGKLNYSAAYTFSKVLGVGGGFYGASNLDSFNTRGRSYGPLSYDRTHALTVAYNYQAPDLGTKLGGNPLLVGVLNGWQLSGISQFQSGGPLQANGLNFNQTGGTGSDNITNRTIAGTPDTTLQPFLACDPTAGLTKNEYFNVSCFVAPSPGKNGLYQFRYIHGPAYMNHDISAFKNFALGKDENRKIQIRVETFNTFNHPLNTFNNTQQLNVRFKNYAQPAVSGQNATNPPVGFTNNKFGHRIVQLGVKFFF